MAFYPNGSAAPRVRPDYLVCVAGGAYGFDNSADALNCLRQLHANGVQATVIQKEA